MTWFFRRGDFGSASSSPRKDTGEDAGPGTTIRGGADADRLFGTTRNDRIFGRDGNDRLTGREGNDTLHGEAGEDTLAGGSGKDSLEGGDGEDILAGQSGDDTMEGGGGDDRILGGSGLDLAVYRTSVFDAVFDMRTSFSVIDTGGREGRDSLSGVEKARFPEGVVFLDGRNTAPFTRPDAFATDEDVDLVVDPVTLLANDRDVNGDPLSIVSVRGTALGEAVIGPDGRIVFSPDENAFGPGGFEYVVSDGRGGETTATVTVDVLPVNDPPVFDETAVAGQTGEDDGPLSGALPFADPDPDDVHGVTVEAGAPTLPAGLTLSDEERAGLSAALGATAVGRTVEWTHAPAAGLLDVLATGEELVLPYTLTLADGAGVTDTATITVTVLGANDPPSFEETAVAVETGEDDGPLSGAVGFSDPDATDTHEVAVEAGAPTLPAGLTLSDEERAALAAAFGATVDGRTVDWTFTPPAGLLDVLGAGEELVLPYALTVWDAESEADTATITITVLGENDPPRWVGPPPATLEMGEDDPVTGFAVSLRFADPDRTDTFTASVDLVDPATTGGPTLPDGLLGDLAASASVLPPVPVAGPAVGVDIPVPDDGFDFLAEGEVLALDYVVSLSDGTETIERTVTVEVTGAEDPPVAEADRYVTTEDEPLTVEAASGLLANDADPEGTPLTVVEVDGQAVTDTGTTISLTSGAELTVFPDGSFLYDFELGTESGTPGTFDHLVEGESAGDTFTYAIRDGAGSTAEAPATVTVEGVDDAPIFLSLSGGGGIEGEENGFDTISFTDFDSESFTFELAIPDLTGPADMTADQKNAVLDALRGTPVASAQWDGLQGSVTYEYDTSLPVYDFLGQGESVTFQPSFTVTDGSGESFTFTTLARSIAGRNDGPAPIQPTVSYTVVNPGSSIDFMTDDLFELFEDPEGDPIVSSSYSALPDGELSSTVDSQVGIDPFFFVNASVEPGETGTLTATLRVADEGSGTDYSDPLTIEIILDGSDTPI